MFLHILFILFLFLIVCTSPESAYEALDAEYEALDAAYRPGALRWYLLSGIFGSPCEPPAVCTRRGTEGHGWRVGEEQKLAEQVRMPCEERSHLSRHLQLLHMRHDRSWQRLAIGAMIAVLLIVSQDMQEAVKNMRLPRKALFYLHYVRDGCRRDNCRRSHWH
jgi:hypothetical protein